MSVVGPICFMDDSGMKPVVPCWLRDLYEYLSSHRLYNDLRVIGCREAYIYHQNGFELVPVEVMMKVFHDPEDFEHQLSELAWQHNLRFDPYHPYLSHDVIGIGRITLIKDVLLGGGSQLFLRLLHHSTPQSELQFEDPHGFMPVFTQNFRRYPWLICGASGVGKTSLLFAELARHFSQQTVVFMDRFQEQPVRYPMWIFLREQSEQANSKGRVKAQHLLDIAFKLGASTLVFGEIRAAELPVYFHGLYSGHRYVYATFHANSHAGLLARMEMIVDGSSALIRRSVASLFLAKEGDDRFIIKDIHLPTEINN